MARSGGHEHKRFGVALFEGLLPIAKSGVTAEVLAGVTLAALAIPEVMGYTQVAGVPVVTGLDTILVPVFVFAVLSSSRHLVVGSDSATADGDGRRTGRDSRGRLEPLRRARRASH